MIFQIKIWIEKNIKNKKLFLSLIIHKYREIYSIIIFIKIQAIWSFHIKYLTFNKNKTVLKHRSVYCLVKMNIVIQEINPKRRKRMDQESLQFSFVVSSSISNRIDFFSFSFVEYQNPSKLVLLRFNAVR